MHFTRPLKVTYGLQPYLCHLFYLFMALTGVVELNNTTEYFNNNLKVK